MTVSFCKNVYTKEYMMCLPVLIGAEKNEKRKKEHQKNTKAIDKRRRE